MSLSIPIDPTIAMKGAASQPGANNPLTIMGQYLGLANSMAEIRARNNQNALFQQEFAGKGAIAEAFRNNTDTATGETNYPGLMSEVVKGPGAWMAPQIAQQELARRKDALTLGTQSWDFGQKFYNENMNRLSGLMPSILGRDPTKDEVVSVMTDGYRRLATNSSVPSDVKKQWKDNMIHLLETLPETGPELTKKVMGFYTSSMGNAQQLDAMKGHFDLVNQGSQLTPIVRNALTGQLTQGQGLPLGPTPAEGLAVVPGAGPGGTDTFKKNLPGFGAPSQGGGMPSDGAAPTAPGAWNLGSLTDKIIASENTTGNPGATNSRSSAMGDPQFLSGTWLGVLKQARPDLAQGKSDQELLAMRADPKLSREMTSYYGQMNAERLDRAGLPVTGATLALAHKFGPDGAIKLAQAGALTPIEQVVGPDVMKANPNLAGQTPASLIGSLSQRFGTDPVQKNPQGGAAPTTDAPGFGLTPAQKEFQTKGAGGVAEYVTTVNDKAMGAMNVLQNIEKERELLKRNEVGGGGQLREALAQGAQGLRRTLKDFGGVEMSKDFENKLAGGSLSAAQQLNMLTISQMLEQLRTAQGPGRMFATEIQQGIKRYPQLATDVNAFEEFLNYVTNRANLALKEQEFAAGYKGDPLGLPAHVNKQLLDSGLIKTEQVTGAAKGAEPPPGSAPPPKPPVRWKLEGGKLVRDQ